MLAMRLNDVIREVGRGARGAHALSRAQAAQVLGQVLAGQVAPLELGALLLAWRIKGETPDELAGFLDALRAHMPGWVGVQGAATVVLPCYNGARRLPALTALLAALLARAGLAVLMHGHASEDARVHSGAVLAALAQQLGADATAPDPATAWGLRWAGCGVSPQAFEENQAVSLVQIAYAAPDFIAAGQISWAPLAGWCAPLAGLLDLRRRLGVRHLGHSVVKLMQPCAEPALLVSSYTHREYATHMQAALQQVGTPALLLRGTEGEPVADPRRTPAMDHVCPAGSQRVQAAQDGPLTHLPELPGADAETTADWIVRVLRGQCAVPAPIARQAQVLIVLARQRAPV